MGRQSTNHLGLAFAILGLLVSPVISQNWVLSEGIAVAMSRMDPIVNPGVVAGHVHNIIGGSKFSQDPSVDVRQSKCSSVNVQADKSNYWAPQLYYRYPDNTLSPMLGSARIYYFNTAKDVVPFPPGLKMLTGTAMTRNATDTRSFGLKISCNHGLQTNKLPTKDSNPGGCSIVTTGIFFPPCGKADGSVDSPDHFSHMMWAHHYSGSDPLIHETGAHCPESHPIHYPTIFVEHNYFFSADQPWRNEDDLLVLSNGDTTGLAYHADFQNGWDQAVLKEAINTCTVGDAVGNCPAFKPTVSMGQAWDCRLEGEIPSEEVGLYKSLPNLPGCNPLWRANMPDTKPTCAAAPAKPGMVAPNSFFRSDWQRMNIPLTLPEATKDKLTSWYLPSVFQGMAPKPGGASSIVVWGSEDSAKYVKVSTVDEVLAKFVGNDGKPSVDAPAAPAPAPASSSSSAAVSVSSAAPTTTTPVAAPNPTNPATTPATTPAATPTTTLSSNSITPNPTAPAAINPVLPGGKDELGNVHLVDVATSASSTVTVTHSATAPAVTVTSKTCRRSKKRRLVARQASDVSDTLRSHISRRNRRQAALA